VGDSVVADVRRRGFARVQRDDDLALGAPLVDVRDRLERCVEREDPVHDRAEVCVVDERGELSQLRPAGPHEQKRVLTPRRFARIRMRRLSRVMAMRRNHGAPRSFAQSGSGGSPMPITSPPGFTTVNDFSSVSPPSESRTTS
jgi:hypothetical protein